MFDHRLVREFVRPPVLRRIDLGVFRGNGNAVDVSKSQGNEESNNPVRSYCLACDHGAD